MNDTEIYPLKIDHSNYNNSTTIIKEFHLWLTVSFWISWLKRTQMISHAINSCTILPGKNEPCQKRVLFFLSQTSFLMVINLFHLTKFNSHSSDISKRIYKKKSFSSLIPKRKRIFFKLHKKNPLTYCLFI
jgi:hypothetical protein